MRKFFLGPDRKLRFIWRAVLFFTVAYWVLPLAFDPLFGFIAEGLRIEEHRLLAWCGCTCGGATATENPRQSELQPNGPITTSCPSE
jgi:hypothetical protein